MDVPAYAILLLQSQEGKVKLYGSSVGKHDLDVKDEIVELNGKCLDNYDYQELTKYIQQCIRTGTVCLRVRRVAGRGIVPQTGTIQDAYSISVDHQAKDKLDKLFASHQINPIDMTKFTSSPPLSQAHQRGGAGNFSQVIENPLYYRHPVPENSGQEVKPQNKATQINSADGGMTRYSNSGSDLNGFVEHSPGKEVEKPKRSSTKHKKSNSSSETPLIESIAMQAKLAYAKKASSQNSLNHPRDSLYEVSNVQQVFDDFSNLDDSGPHREMAVDCPEHFIATVKAPPRYPPPQCITPNSSRSDLSSPSKSIDHPLREKVRTERSPKGAASQSQRPPTYEELERMKRHKEELRKRKEDENRLLQEQEFLRTSLRGSKKLQALENKKLSLGVVNTAFIDEQNIAHESLPLETIKYWNEKPVNRNIGVEDLFLSLHRIQNKLGSSGDKKDIVFLKTLFHNSQFQQAVRIHNKVTEVTATSPPLQPTCSSSQELLKKTADKLKQSDNPYAKELQTLLQGSALKGLLKAHDTLAQKDSQLVTASKDEDSDYSFSQCSGDTVKIVHLEKTNEPLGATVKNEGESLLVARIVKGGTAEKSGLLHEGDEILEINGTQMKGKSVDTVSEMLAEMTGIITFMIVPNCSAYSQLMPNNNSIHVRALFNYEPEDDDYIPCRELGISFLKGDILHVIDKEDKNWWQAYRDKEDELQVLAGLIPSQFFQEQREMLRQSCIAESKESKKGRACICSKRNEKKRRRKGMYNVAMRDEAEDILTYEEVAQYLPEPNRKRPIVLIGPQHVGRLELRQRLMEDMERFAAAVPHTTRAQKPGEVDHKDYYFVKREVFEGGIVANKFVEYGELDKVLYGTTVNAIMQVVTSGKTCILNLQPESLRILKQSDLKPYIVFVRPPNLEKLKQILAAQNLHLTDAQNKEIIDKAREMEDLYGHHFDYILVNTDMNRAYEELLAEIDRLEVELQWVPKHWVDR